MSIGIYKITSPSNKIYIGQSKDIEFRWSFYLNLYCKKQTKIYNSLKKYGPENHIFEIIEECKLDKLDEREIYWKQYYNSVNDGLNCSLIDYSPMRGKKHSDETRKKISESKKGWKPHPSRAIKISLKTKGLKRTEEQNKIRSEIMKGIPKPKGFGEIISKKKKGNKLGPMSNKHKKLISEQRKGKGVKELFQYDLEGNFIKKWGSVREACIKIWGSYYKYETCISNCCRGITKKSYGYIWSYKKI